MQHQIKEILKEVAAKHNKDYHIVEQVYRSTFFLVHKAMRELRDIRLIYIGIFRVRWRMLDKLTRLANKFKNDERYKDVRDRVGR